MQRIRNGIVCLFPILILACSALNNTSQEEGQKSKPIPILNIRAGINKGGITDNTNMQELENVELDAFSGATKLGVNTSVHCLFPVKRNYIETGIDYMLNNQAFVYADALNNYAGERKIVTSQFMLPITYNFRVLKKLNHNQLLQLKVGYLFQYNVYNINDKGVALPAYTTNNFASGITLGFESTLFKFGNGNAMGFYFDIYKGSQVYNDLYNQQGFEVSGSSFFKAGIVYQLEA